jgi:hypothetical protein
MLLFMWFYYMGIPQKLKGNVSPSTFLLVQIQGVEIGAPSPNVSKVGLM